MSDTTYLTPATELEKLLREVANGDWQMSGQLSMISEKCMAWQMTYPEQFAEPYNRFERARQAVRIEATDSEWEELKEAALQLADAFEAAVS